MAILIRNGRVIDPAAKTDGAADVLIASDGPRLAPERPTIFLGARGAMAAVKFDEAMSVYTVSQPPGQRYG